MPGLGTDIIEIKRIADALKREAFVKRVYTEHEQEYFRARGVSAAESAAGMFCAKEAVAKALGTGFRMPIRSIEIGHDELGSPYVISPGGRFLLSISHCKEYATATAILLEEEA
ncbi:MAG: holo-ACP synthase [Butyricicoccaceae bacterium]